MNQKHVMGRRHNPKHALLFWALVIIIAGGLLSWFFSTQEADLDSRRYMLTTIAITVLLAGILIISATANWWLKR